MLSALQSLPAMTTALGGITGLGVARIAGGNPKVQIAATIGGALAGLLGGMALSQGNPISDALRGTRVSADMVCDQSITGRQWCHEATDADVALESSAAGSDSSAMSSEDSYGY